MKYTNNSLLYVFIFTIVYISFINTAFAIQPGWTKAQVIKELGEPNNIMQDPTYGEYGHIIPHLKIIISLIAKLDFQ